VSASAILANAAASGGSDYQASSRSNRQLLRRGCSRQSVGSNSIRRLQPNSVVPRAAGKLPNLASGTLAPGANAKPAFAVRRPATALHLLLIKAATAAELSGRRGFVATFYDEAGNAGLPVSTPVGQSQSQGEVCWRQVANRFIFPRSHFKVR